MPGRPRSQAFRFDSLDAFQESGYQTRPTQTKDTCGLEGKHVRIGVAAMQGWRKTMEDTWDACVDPSPRGAAVGFAGVFDGHNGDTVAQHLAKTLRGLVYAELDSLAAGGDVAAVANSALKEGMQRVFLEADEKVREAFGGEATEATGATAAAVVLTGDGRLAVAHAGDARCVLSRQGKAVPMSSDHRADVPAEAERVRACGGTVEGGRVVGARGKLAVTRAIGDWVFKKTEGRELREQPVTSFPDVAVTALAEGDEFAVVASDGVWDLMGNAEVVAFVRERLQTGSEDLSEICGAVCEKCLAPKCPGRGCDNITVAVMQFAHHGPAAGRPLRTETSCAMLLQDWRESGAGDDHGPL
eukprot:TRINITY_DN1547_c0_g6_i1.p1 TRINITY_DN1547_c0_g6~~TRINITY_DN1547_c0_g6_i1.p1  ORF type:complete len:357 (+),score=79.76 TRINITY_DN1547_c0_g6_i1:202-1272(+)